MTKRCGDDDALVSLREGGRRLGIANLHSHISRYGTHPEPVPGSGGYGPPLYTMRSIREWYAATVAKPRRPPAA